MFFLFFIVLVYLSVPIIVVLCARVAAHSTTTPAGMKAERMRVIQAFVEKHSEIMKEMSYNQLIYI